MLATRAASAALRAARVARAARRPPVAAAAPRRGADRAPSGAPAPPTPPRLRDASALVASLPPDARPGGGGGEAVALAAAQAPGGGAADGPPSPLARAWAAYDGALAKHPIAVKAATSFVGFLLGDLIAQNIVGLPYDAHRTLRLVLFGVCMDGPIGHLWYTTLDRHVYPADPTSTRAVVTKTALDQLLWAPAFSCVFFAFINVLDGRPEAVIPSIQAKLLPMMLANYALWPAAHLINFKFVPSRQRILYINCVQILWSAYLSHLSAGALRSTGRF